MLTHIRLGQARGALVIPWEQRDYSEEAKRQQEREWAAKSGPVMCRFAEACEIDRLMKGAARA